MFDLNSVLKTDPFSLKKSQKDELYRKALLDLTKHHYKNCLPYKKILDHLGHHPTLDTVLEDYPFIPVRLFKSHELCSIDQVNVTKTLSSSGTSDQSLSKIFLDKETSVNQTKVLCKIITHFIGPKRLPLLIIDAKPSSQNRQSFSAKEAGILGFSLFGHDITYALDENLEFDFETFENFCQKHKKILIFGFTFMVWQHFYQKIKDHGLQHSLKDSILIHGGGWKKLQQQAVDDLTFKNKLKDVCGIQNVHNYYGMIEQTGSIFMECQEGFLHSSLFSDVMIRRSDFSICDFQEKGIVQLLSLIPKSYPGHNILSEDCGELVGQDNCRCGRLGKYFKIHGRLKNAEARGCSDVYSR